MNLIIKNFQKDYYHLCIEPLKIFIKEQNDPVMNFLCQNNLLVCQVLMKENNGIRAVNISAESWLSLFQNCFITSKHCQKPMIELQLTIIYNAAWLLLSLPLNPTYSMESEQILHSFTVFMSKLGFGSSAIKPQASLQDKLTAILKTKTALIASRSTALRIFTEVTALITLHLMNISSKPDMAALQEFLQSFLEDCSEISALCETINPSMDIFKLDSISDTSYSRPTRLLEIISDVIAINTNVTPCLHRIDNVEDGLTSFMRAVGFQRKYEYKKALGYALQALTKTASEFLQSKVLLLLGKIYSDIGERHKALESFSKSLKINKRCPFSHYFIGREFGKMGLHDSMLKSYKNLVKTLTVSRPPTFAHGSIVEYHIHKLIHRNQEISEHSALYILAVAYAINERFDESASVFRQVVSERNMSLMIGKEASEDTEVILLPHVVTILHEAATVFILTGDLEQSEFLISQAIAAYPTRKNRTTPAPDAHGTKDYQWIRNLLLNELNMEVDEHPSDNYYEDYLSIFDEDLIGLLLLADIYRIQESGEASKILNKALILLSKYISRVKNDNDIKNQAQTALVNGLACKTCLHLARAFISIRTFDDVNKMFKRALSCNKGDKDVLYHYVKFLLDSNKPADANNLIKKFCDEQSNVLLNNSQSLAIRYLLRNQKTQSQLSSMINQHSMSSTNNKI